MYRNVVTSDVVPPYHASVYGKVSVSFTISDDDYAKLRSNLKSAVTWHERARKTITKKLDECRRMLYSQIVKRRYPLDRSLRSLFLIHTPLNRALFPLAFAFLRLFSLHGDRRLDVKRYSIGKTVILDVSPKGSGGNIPVIIYLHGGAFVYRAAPYHYRLVREYALSGCRVLMVDYPLSPGSRYPIAVEKTVEVYKWALEHFSSSVAVMGDSAGAEIALSSTMRIIEEGLGRPQFLALIYPVVAPIETESKRRFTDTPVWNSRLNSKMWEYYLGDKEYRSIFDCGCVSSFPPVYIETCALDCLHDEGESLVFLLEENGIPVVHRNIEGACHGYDMISSSPLVKESMEARKSFIMKHLC